jgi:hypothetical protein
LPCLYPDTEILTNKGWVFIKDLKRNEKIAQWNQETNSIDFTFPLKYIENNFDGNMIQFEGKHIDIIATPNHQQPYKTIYKNDNTFNRKKEIKDLKTSYNIKIPVSGNNKGNNCTLTPLMRFKIITQADGYLAPERKTKDYRIVQFKFTKKRKIKRFKDIVIKAGLEYKEIKPQNKTLRFQVQAPLDISKSLWDIIDIEKINSKFVDEFINELIEWDGSKKKNMLYYSTKSSKNADFIQAICALGGWTCSRTIQHDNRKKSYSSIHRLYFYKKSFRESQCLKRKEVPYKGKVYCVRVPSGNIIIRRNNKVMVTGNCHQVKSHELKQIMSKAKIARYRFGFTGTLYDDVVENWNVSAFIGPVLKEYPSGFLAEQGYISKCNVSAFHINYTSVNDEIRYYPDVKKEVFFKNFRLKFISELVRFTDHNVLLLVSTIEEGNMLKQFLSRSTEKEVEFLQGKDKVAVREEWRRRMINENNIALIATYGIFQQGINIPNLKYAILASPSKSKIRVLQSVGRALRKHENKEEEGAYIFDIIDEVRHLGKHGDVRLSYYEREGFEVHEHKLYEGIRYNINDFFDWFISEKEMML